MKIPVIKVKLWNNQLLKLIIKMQFYFLKYLLLLKNIAKRKAEGISL